MQQGLCVQSVVLPDSSSPVQHQWPSLVDLLDSIRVPSGKKNDTKDADFNTTIHVHNYTLSHTCTYTQKLSHVHAILSTYVINFCIT